MKTYQQEPVGAGKRNSTSNVGRTTKAALQAPAKALNRLAAQEATSSDILTLQRSIGNRTATNLIQRHSEEDLREFFSGQWMQKQVRSSGWSAVDVVALGQSGNLSRHHPYVNSTSHVGWVATGQRSGTKPTAVCCSDAEISRTQRPGGFWKPARSQPTPSPSLPSPVYPGQDRAHSIDQPLIGGPELGAQPFGQGEVMGVVGY